MKATFQFAERKYIKWVEKMNKSCKTKVIIRYNPNNYLCPICTEFTSYDEWAKPQVACINCGIEE